MRKLGDTDVFNKTVALRVDLNVPVKDGKVLDDTRILAITQTLNYLKQQKSKTVLISHFGRPEPGIHDEKLSLFPVCLLYTSPSPRDATLSRMPSSA